MKKTWLEETRKSDYMKTYRSFTDDDILNRCEAVYSHLIDWLQTGASSDEVENYFENVGMTRLKEGFPLTEVHYALYLTKKVLWDFVDWRDAITGSFETKTAKQIMTILNNYFDLGNFYITKGYFEALFEKIDESKKFSKDELKRLFLKGAQDWDSLTEEDIIWRHV